MFASCLFLLSFVVTAFPTLASSLLLDSRVSMDVFVPRVLYPHAGTVWRVNETRHVAWDLSEMPENITNPIGRVLLRKGDKILPVFLAAGFDVRLGETPALVPWVMPDTDYSIVFFGDSGDYSDPFTISD